MSELRYLTGGESHGPFLASILSGMPCGVPISPEKINIELNRRQSGFGRGDRMKIEADSAQIISGIRNGMTTGAPISMLIKNKDHENWQAMMSVVAEGFDPSRNVTRPRPGHADLAGSLKYNQTDARNILERASARGTASQVAIGAICKMLLSNFNITVFSHVVKIGGIAANNDGRTLEEIKQLSGASDLRCADKDAEIKMKDIITEVKTKGDTIGGIVEVIAEGVPLGLGSSMNPDEKLDGMLAGALMSVQAIKGVEIGLGFKVADLPGSKVHDRIYYQKPAKGSRHLSGGFYSDTNNAGGTEGGISNGRNIVLRAAMKPIPSLSSPLKSVDMITKEPFDAVMERSDVCAVSAAGIVLEAVAAFILSREFLKKFGGDSLKEIKRNFESYLLQLEEF